MSQLTLTPEQDVMVLNAVRARHAQVLSAYGVEDADLVALLASIESQLTPVVAAVPVVEEPPEVAIAEAEAEAMEAAEETPAEE